MKALLSIVLSFTTVLACFSQQWRKQFTGHWLENYILLSYPEYPGISSQLRLIANGNQVTGDFTVYPWRKENIIPIKGFIRADTLFLKEINVQHRPEVSFVCYYDSSAEALVAYCSYKRKRFGGLFKETNWTDYKIIYCTYPKGKSYHRYPLMVMNPDTAVQESFNQFIGKLTGIFTDARIKKCKDCGQYIDLDDLTNDQQFISLERTEYTIDGYFVTYHIFDLANKKELLLNDILRKDSSSMDSLKSWIISQIDEKGSYSDSSKYNLQYEPTTEIGLTVQVHMKFDWDGVDIHFPEFHRDHWVITIPYTRFVEIMDKKHPFYSWLVKNTNIGRKK